MSTGAVRASMTRIVDAALGLVAVGSSAFGVLVILGNYSILFANIRNVRQGIKRYISFVPIVGPMLLTFGCLQITFIASPPTWLIVASWLADPGTWVTAAAVPAAWSRRRR